MGKSIRSKRKKRLRTLKREIVEPHYDAKEQLKMAAQEAALLAPKIELPTKRRDMEDIPPHRHFAGDALEPMFVDGGKAISAVDSKLKARRVIGKRGRSVKREMARKRKKNTHF